MDTPTPCPDENAFAGMIEGLLSEVEVQALEAHLDRCPACSELFIALAGARPGRSGGAAWPVGRPGAEVSPAGLSPAGPPPIAERPYQPVALRYGG